MKETRGCLEMGAAYPAGCQVKPLTQVKAFTGLHTGPSAHRSCQFPTRIPPGQAVLSSPIQKPLQLLPLPRGMPPTAHPNPPWGTLSTSSNLHKSKPEATVPSHEQRFSAQTVQCCFLLGLWRCLQDSPLSNVSTRTGTGLYLITQSVSLALKISCSVKLFTVWLTKNMIKNNIWVSKGI